MEVPTHNLPWVQWLPELVYPSFPSHHKHEFCKWLNPAFRVFHLEDASLMACQDSGTHQQCKLRSAPSCSSLPEPETLVLKHFYSCWNTDGKFMCATSPSAVTKNPHVKLRYAEVTINMSLHVYHLEQSIQNVTRDWACPVGTVLQADPFKFCSVTSY